MIADSAYSDRRRRAELRRRGLIDAICRKRSRGQAGLCGWQERWNTMGYRLRARVEHVLGHAQAAVRAPVPRTARRRRRAEVKWAIWALGRMRSSNAAAARG